MEIDFEQLKGLLEIVAQNDIGELTVESGEERITVKKPAAGGSLNMPSAVHYAPAVPHAPAHLMPPPAVPGEPAPAPPHPAAAQASAVAPPAVPHETAPAAQNNNYLKITSPMVGTFYRSPSPDKPAFVEVGDNITVGQTICIIEAMKLMNDLPAEVSGRIVEILADNGATVEYGQPLFLVEPVAT